MSFFRTVFHRPGHNLVQAAGIRAETRDIPLPTPLFRSTPPTADGTQPIYRRDEHRVRPGGAPRVKVPSTEFDVSIEDWDDLFRAVIAQLAQAVPDPSRSMLLRHASSEAPRTGIDVLDCVTALNQLRATALHEFARLKSPEASRKPPIPRRRASPVHF